MRACLGLWRAWERFITFGNLMNIDRHKTICLCDSADIMESDVTAFFPGFYHSLIKKIKVKTKVFIIT